MPSKEAINNETVMEDEKNEFKYDYWFDGIDRWNTTLHDDDSTWKNIEMTVVEEE
jgi:hypothetical protein